MSLVRIMLNKISQSSKEKYLDVMHRKHSSGHRRLRGRVKFDGSRFRFNGMESIVETDSGIGHITL